MHRPRHRAPIVLCAATFATLAPAALRSSRAAVTFNFVPAPGMDPRAVDGFTAAGRRWSALLADDVTVNINIDFAPLAGGALASTNSSQTNYPYANTRAAMLADAAGADDTTAVGFLQPTPAAGMFINYTSDSPHGPGSPTPYFDNDGGGNNANVRVHHANAKALALRSPGNPASDASITFNSGFAWDFNPLDGMTPSAFDFVGIATHEIGHALGFSSNVDFLDANSPGGGGGGGGGTFPGEDEVVPKLMDLFRYSAESRAQGAGVFDVSADPRAKYFSIDGGATSLAPLATGRMRGDGHQAGHWKGGLNLGLMDATTPSGTPLFVSPLDHRMFDVIGWNPNNTWEWADPAGGLFNSGIRWYSTAVPGAGQTAVWNLDAAYTVSFTTPRTTANAQVRAGVVTFNLGGAIYNAGASLSVAPAAGETATLNLAAGAVSATTVSIGGTASTAGGTGVLALDAGGVLNAANPVRVWPGGTLRYNGGAVAAPLIRLDGGTIHAAAAAAADVQSGVPVTTGGGTLRVDAGAVHTLGGALTTTGGTLEKTGPGTLVIAGPQSHAAGALLKTSAGTTTLQTNAGSASAPGTLNLVANAATTFEATQNLASLTVGPSATATLAAGGTRTIKTRAIAVAGGAAGGKLDLADNRLVVDYAGSTPIAAVAALLTTGYNGGTWDGPGITSSLAGNSGVYTLGYGESRQILAMASGETRSWGGQSVDATSVLVRYTYGGDANLDGAITGDDYSNIDFGILFPGMSGYANGDFNYDGFITGDDYSVIDLNILLQGPPLGAAGPTGGLVSVSAVPEPAACAIASSLVVAGALTRRRRRRGTTRR